MRDKVDATVEVIERTDDKGYTRTAIVLEREKTHDLDIVGPDGELFCRLNIICPYPDGRWGNVDVIWNKDEQEGKALAWCDGKNVLTHEAEGSCLIAVSIAKKGYGGSQD